MHKSSICIAEQFLLKIFFLHLRVNDNMPSLPTNHYIRWHINWIKHSCIYYAVHTYVVVDRLDVLILFPLDG